MLEVFIFCIVSALINHLLGRFFTTKISKSTNAEETVKLRKQFRTARMVVKAIFAIVIITDIFYLTIVWFENDINHFSLQHKFMLLVIMAMFTYSTMSLPISGITLSQFKKNKKDYALYLRGFATDDYTPLMAEKVEHARNMKNYGPFTSFDKEDRQHTPFSERDFQKALKKYIPLYGVGMTKELESPEGAKRIYLDDETWQADVSYLIKHAKYVFIKVNPSDSCIWEINESLKKASEKLIFIVDNKKAISEIHKKLDGKLPDGLRLDIPKHTAIVKKHRAYVEISYRNDVKGFRKLLKEIFK